MWKRFLLFSFVSGISGLALGQNVADSLIQGAWSGQAFVVKSALASGRVDVDVQTSEGYTALMLASLAGHENVIDVLLEAGADTDLANADGETALILASKYGFTEVAARLIEAGAQPDVVDTSGRSAWTWASWGENSSLVQRLEASGADRSQKVDPFADGKPVDRFEKAPTLKKYKAPKIPKASKGRLNGSLRISLVVRRDGTPDAIELLQGIDQEVDASALEMAKGWRFEPGEVQNKPVDGMVQIHIEYRPRDDPKGKEWVSTRRWRN